MEDVTDSFWQQTARETVFMKRRSRERTTLFSVFSGMPLSGGKSPERIGAEVREPEDELQIQIFLGKYRRDSMICRLNPKEHYLVTERGTVYRVPEEFSRYMTQYQEDCFGIHMKSTTGRRQVRMKKPEGWKIKTGKDWCLAFLLAALMVYVAVVRFFSMEGSGFYAEIHAG